MRYCFLVILFLFGMGLNKASLPIRSAYLKIEVSSVAQMGPIYFIRPVPEKLRLLDRIDLSFMKSSIITIYRYRLEIPSGNVSAIDRKINAWSPWAREDITKIIIPHLDVEGGYRLIVEYRTEANEEIKKFEKSFLVYSNDPKKTNIIIQSKTAASPQVKSTSEPSSATTIAEAKKNTPSGNITSGTTSTVEKSAAKTKPAVEKTVAKPDATQETRSEKQTPPVDRSSGKTPAITEKEAGLTAQVTGNSKIQNDPSDGSKMADLKSGVKESENTQGLLPAPDKELTMVQTTSGHRESEPVAESSINRHEVITIEHIIISDLKTKPDLGQHDFDRNKSRLAVSSIDRMDIRERDNPGYYRFIIEPVEKAEIISSENFMVRNAFLSQNLISVKSGLLRNPPDFDLLFTGAFNKVDSNVIRNLPAFRTFTAFNYENSTSDVIRSSPDYHSLTAESVIYKDKDLLDYTSSGDSPQSASSTGMNPPSADNPVLNDPEDITPESTSDTETTKRDIFGILNYPSDNEDFISQLRLNGISVNESDSNGNTPLHFAILLEDNEAAKNLIDQGADLNRRNSSDLSPLHIAVLKNNEELVKNLLSHGADANLKGKSGYTPLSIASEKNYPGIVKMLLINGAKRDLRTDQGLSPGALARIQKNEEIISLLRRIESGTYDPTSSLFKTGFTGYNSGNYKYPDIDFNLPFDNKLTKRRQINKALQIISVPVLTLSVTCLTFAKSEANHYYNLSKIAETEAMAIEYYDKTKKYDRYSNIMIGVSLVSAYGLVHSTIRKRTISGKMLKTFDH